MRERPIIFNPSMVRATLDKRKRQARIIVKPQPVLNHATWKWRDYRWAIDRYRPIDVFANGSLQPCPLGHPGDYLWVRETCRAEELSGGLDGVRYLSDNAFIPVVGSALAADRWLALYAYRGTRGAKVPSIHMPRWASRITLEITSIRVERLQNITEADALAEGCTPDWLDVNGVNVNAHGKPTYRQGFARFWRDINGDDSWSTNPWIWVVNFRRVATGGESDPPLSDLST